MKRLPNHHRRLLRGLIILGLGLFSGILQAASTVTYIHNDALGSPIAATDEAGQVVWREDYKPYGERIRKETAADSHTLWYTGKPQEEGFGLSYFGARWYDPELGRFTGYDPAAFHADNVQSFNRYAYANNNPYKFVDPDGNSPKDIRNRRISSLFKLDAGFGPGINSSGRLDVGSGPGFSTYKSDLRALKNIENQVAKGGPKIGGGGSLDKLTSTEIKRIQNAANRSGQEIGVVGSRVNPNKALHSKSDFDFVINANSKTRNNLSRSLPGAKNVREGIPNNQDIFKGTVDTSKPHVIFRPQ